MPIFFQFCDVRQGDQHAEKHHFVKADTPEEGFEKVKKIYPEEVTVVFRSSLKASLQQDHQYRTLIK